MGGRRALGWRQRRELTNPGLGLGQGRQGSVKPQEGGVAYDGILGALDGCHGCHAQSGILAAAENSEAQFVPSGVYAELKGICDVLMSISPYIHFHGDVVMPAAQI